MKNCFLLLLSFIFSFSLLAQNAEEAAIIKVIEDETHFINQRDYDQWASLWVHSPNAYYSNSGPDGYDERKGWEEISKWTKEFIKNNPNPWNGTLERTNYNFLIDGKMAFVTFDEEGNHSTCLLQNIDGTWKIAEMGYIQAKRYESQERAAEMKRLIEEMEGRWHADLESVESRSLDVEIYGFDLEVTADDRGEMVMEGFLEIKFPNGEPSKEWNRFHFFIPNDPEKVLVVYCWSWLASPGKATSSAILQADDNKKYNGDFTFVYGENPYVNITFDFKSGTRFRLDWSLLNREGNEAWGTGLDLVKEGL